MAVATVPMTHLQRDSRLLIISGSYAALNVAHFQVICKQDSSRP